MNQIVKDSFIAISDFHSYNWPLDKVINYYLNEYDKIFILGDATDRGQTRQGDGGLDLLFDIKTLTEQLPDKVIYIPGNHDEFVYEYAMGNDNQAANLEANGGKKTKEDIDKLEKENPGKLKELTNWLGNLPLQRMHTFNGKTYALAHALFKQNIYDQLPDLSLKDITSTSYEIRQYMDEILWFRKKDMEYNKNDLPRGNVTMIVGHTPEKYRRGENLDLVNQYGENVTVKCVDGGIAYEDKMVKYDGGANEIRTIRGEHHDTSPKNNNSYVEVTSEQESLFKEIVLELFQNAETKDKGYQIISNYCLNGNNNVIQNEQLRQIANSYLNSKVISSIMQNYSYQRLNQIYTNQLEMNLLLKDYTNEQVLDLIFNCSKERYGSKEAALNQVQSFFSTNNFDYITESIGKARSTAKKVGIEDLRNTIAKSGNNDIKEYFVNKFNINQNVK